MLSHVALLAQATNCLVAAPTGIQLVALPKCDLFAWEIFLDLVCATQGVFRPWHTKIAALAAGFASALNSKSNLSAIFG
jgi:hypothetical protein